VLGSLKCDCRDQLDAALERIEDAVRSLPPRDRARVTA
jgi:GTP cyclohydrolase II